MVFLKTPGLENHREKTLPIASYRCWLALSAPLCSLWSSISFILELGVKELVSELLVTYICHKHGLSKATHFSPDFVLTLFPSSPGCWVTSPWGLMTFPGTLHFFTTHTGKTTPAKFPHSGSTCKTDAGGALEKRQEYQSPKILAAQLPSWSTHPFPRISGLAHRTLLLCVPPPAMLYFFSLTHTHICLLLFENKMFSISLEELLEVCFFFNICSHTSESPLSSDKKGEFNANSYFHLSPNTAASSTDFFFFYWLWFFWNELGIHERAQIDRLESDGRDFCTELR